MTLENTEKAKRCKYHCKERGTELIISDVFQHSNPPSGNCTYQHVLKTNNSTLCPQNVFMCSVRFLQ
jgi:hypothetical protein